MSAASATSASVAPDGGVVSRDLLRAIILRQQYAGPLPSETVQALARHGLAARTLPLVTNAGTGAGQLLRETARREQLRALRVAGVAVRLHCTLAEHGVPGLLYKGPALGALLGESIGERPCADVDLLVSWRDVARVGALLEAEGYVRDAPHGRIPSRLERWMQCERTYGHPLQVPADVHWRVDTPSAFRVPFDAVWRRRALVQIGNEQVPTLEPIDALLVTAVHGGREQWARWKWVVDASRQVLQLDDDELREAVHRARGAGCATAVAVALAMVEGLGIREMPQGAASDPRAFRMAESVLRTWAGAPPLDESVWSGVRRRHWKWKLADTRRSQVSGLVAGITRQSLARTPGRPSQTRAPSDDGAAGRAN